MVTALVFVVEVVRRRMEERAAYIIDEDVAEKLIKEDVFSDEVTNRWPGNVLSQDEVIEGLKSFEDWDVLVTPRRLEKILEAASRRATEVASDDDLREWHKADEILKSAAAMLPSREEYLQAIRRIEPEIRPRVLERSYRTYARPPYSDQVAFPHLELMRDVGEHDVLLKILAERFLRLRHDIELQEAASPPRRIRSTRMAYRVTEIMAE